MNSPSACSGHAPAAVLARLLDERYSCRAFLPDPVPRERIETMLQTAQKTASWCNSQPWQVIVTEAAATDRFREALFDHAQTVMASPEAAIDAPDLSFPARYAGVYKDRQRETGWGLYQSVGIAYGDREASGRQMMENYRLFGAPHVMIVTTEADLGVYGAVDCGAYVATLLLVARSLGIDTIAQAAIAGMAGFVHAHFAIPPTRRIVCGLSFGYADPAHPANAFRTRRAALADVARFVAM